MLPSVPFLRWKEWAILDTLFYYVVADSAALEQVRLRPRLDVPGRDGVAALGASLKERQKRSAGSGQVGLFCPFYDHQEHLIGLPV